MEVFKNTDDTIKVDSASLANVGGINYKRELTDKVDDLVKKAKDQGLDLKGLTDELNQVAAKLADGDNILGYKEQQLLLEKMTGDASEMIFSALKSKEGSTVTLWDQVLRALS